MGISNMALVKIAAIGGVATVTMGLLLRAKIQSNIKQTEHYKDAIKSLRNHKGAVELLGEPIKEGSIDIDDEEKNFTKHYSAKYEVPVKGPKGKGILYFWAKRQTDTDKWTVNRVELGLENENDRHLLIQTTDI